VVELFEQLKHKINGKNKIIVFPEGEDARIQGAAVRLASEGLIKPILLGDEKLIAATASSKGFDLSEVKIINPLKYNAADLAELNAKLVETLR